MTFQTGRLALLCCVCSMASLTGLAQQPMAKDAHPVFDVVTVKPTPPDEHSQGFQTRGTHLVLVRETVLSMMMFAYGVHGSQIVNAPDWVRSQAFNVDGVPDVSGEPNLVQFQGIVKALLVDRFGLQVRPDKRELSYYALRVASGGPKLLKSVAADDQAPDQTGNGGQQGQMMKFTNNTIDEFALGMQYFTDRAVVNETALQGRFDFTLRWMPDSLKAQEADAPPGLFTAMREQLGLDMKSEKGPVPVLVVTHVSEPGAN